MSEAADILRERARLSEERVAGYGIMSPDELRAVADLMEAQYSVEVSYQWRGGCEVPNSRRAVGTRCKLCGRFAGVGVNVDHAADCPLAALERLITGESDESLG